MAEIVFRTLIGFYAVVLSARLRLALAARRAMMGGEN